MENNNNRTRIIIFWVVVCIIIALVGWYFFSQKQTIAPTNYSGQVATSTQTASTTNQTNGVKPTGATTEIAPGVFVTPTQPQTVNAPAPALDRSLPDTSKLDPALVSRMKTDIQLRVSNLQKNKTSFSDWIDLGFDRKALGDYEGASQAWEYVSLLYPQNLISFGNLGDLYVTFLKDYAKAETAYKTAIKNSPTTIDNYRNLFNVFITENKNSDAVALLVSGISKNPNTFDLQILLARYYRDSGNNTQAKTYYDQAISVAQKQGNTSVVQSLQVEESAL